MLIRKLRLISIDDKMECVKDLPYCMVVPCCVVFPFSFMGAAGGRGYGNSKRTVEQTRNDRDGEQVAVDKEI